MKKTFLIPVITLDGVCVSSAYVTEEEFYSVLIDFQMHSVPFYLVDVYKDEERVCKSFRYGYPESE